MTVDSWRANPGRRKGADLPIEDFLTRGYQAHEWLLNGPAFRREPIDRRVQKGRFCTRLNITRPSVNKYLKGGGIPFPFPPADHLVFVVDADDRTVRWLSPSMCQALGRPEDFFVGRDARSVFRRERPTEPGHAEALEALRRGELDTHACRTEFVRYSDGLWLPLNIKVSYGELYHVWFTDAVPDGEMTPLSSPQDTAVFNVEPDVIIEMKHAPVKERYARARDQMVSAEDNLITAIGRLSSDPELLEQYLNKYLLRYQPPGLRES